MIQMAKNKEYWKRRERKNISKQIKSDNKLAKEIMRNQREALDNIEEQIESFYGRYATKEGITMEQARKRVAKTNIKKYERKAKKYVKENNFSKRANEEMRLYNVTMRTRRLELLQANINLELVAMINEEESLIDEGLFKQAREEYERQAGILGQTLNYNEKNIEKIVSASFQNATWSDRIWSNQNELRKELEIQLNKGITQGKNPNVLARDIRKTFDTSLYNSERLMRTEMGRVQIQVQEDSFKKAGVEEYIFIAEVDEKTSDVCLSMDGEIVKVKDMQVGSNAPPLHPFCRSSTAAYVERE